MRLLLSNDGLFFSMEQDKYISAVKHWLEKTIIGFNFCPFAKREFVNNAIHYEVVDDSNRKEQLLAFSNELTRLNEHPEIETTLVVFPKGLESFFDYLDLLEIANNLSYELGFEGLYQLASFHPDYCFEGVLQSAPSNYTNRSPYPVIHIIREASLEKVLDKYPNPEDIPERNIQFAEEKGSAIFQTILKESIALK